MRIARHAGWWLLIVVLLVSRGNATQTVPMSVRTMTDHAAVVFVGTVTALDAVRHDDRRGIETTVTFGDIEWLKGAVDEDDESFTLLTPGGTVDGWRAEVAGAPRFAVGDRMLLFILPSWSVHPVVGVMRGCVRFVVGDDGVERAYTLGGAITGLDERGHFQTAGSACTAACGHATDERTRLLAHAPPVDAWTTANLLDALRPIARTSRTHADVTDPGRRRPVRFRAAPVVVNRAGAKP